MVQTLMLGGSKSIPLETCTSGTSPNNDDPNDPKHTSNTVKVDPDRKRTQRKTINSASPNPGTVMTLFTHFSIILVYSCNQEIQTENFIEKKNKQVKHPKNMG